MTMIKQFVIRMDVSKTENAALIQQLLAMGATMDDPGAKSRVVKAPLTKFKHPEGLTGEEVIVAFVHARGIVSKDQIYSHMVSVGFAEESVHASLSDLVWKRKIRVVDDMVELA